MVDTNEYTEQETKDGEAFRNLGKLYFRSDNISRMIFDKLEKEYFAKDVIKKAADMIYEYINDNLPEWLMYDGERNLSNHIKSAVEAEINDILSGNDSALKYVSGYRCKALRYYIVEKYADKLKNERIKDLEDEVSRLREALRYR